MKRKPDALLLLALVFGLGLIISTVTHGGGEADRAERMAASVDTSLHSDVRGGSLNR